ncbi:MAG TPA: alpha/beta hydrolase [Longimicrobiales bacterium]|nr:alpha/beta hydrolase [Longimicrobiales bacterium]
MRKWFRRIVLGVLALVLVAIAAGLSFEQWSRWRAGRDFPAPGQMVAFDGGRTHLACEGTGTPTVILESGFGAGGSEDWVKVQPAIAGQTRVCAYDRGGIMWSTPRGRPRDAAHIADELQALLRAADEPGPYVMVGHSIGGALVRVFTGRFPDEVVGLVFVDATPPGLMSRLPADMQAAMSAGPPAFLIRLLAATGVMRFGDPGIPEMWPDSARAAIRAMLPLSVRGMHGEMAAMDDALAEAGAVTTLGNRPLVVLTAGKHPFPPSSGVSDSSIALMEQLWPEMQNELATLSSNADHRTIASSNHYIQLDDPGAVIDAVARVVRSVRDNVPLQHGAR